MNLVEWSNILPSTASVIYSTLAVPDFERSSLNREVAQIALPAGRFIDVEWCEKKSIYVVTLFRDEFENVLVQQQCETPQDVVDFVTDLADPRSRLNSKQSAKESA